MGAEGGFGVQVYIGDGNVASTPDYTLIARLEDINPFGQDAVMDDITAHDSTEGFKRKLPTGEFQGDDVELNLIHDMDQATQANAAGGIYYAWKNNTQLAWKIVFPDASTFVFDAYVSRYEITGVKAKAMRSKAKLAIDGVIART